MTCQHCGAPLPPIALFCGECGRSVAAPLVVAPVTERPMAPMTAPEAQPETNPVPTVASVTEPTLPAAVTVPATSDSEACTSCGEVAEPDDLYCGSCGHALSAKPNVFVLQFSTGESYTVQGSGLAGRNPRPEPGEYVDHLVTIVDPGRSVSKTHLEFGQHDGVLWVCDRHSGNGTAIREPDGAVQPCIPGRRYAVVRGARVDLGDQHMVVL